MLRQSDLAREVHMQQSRISMFETPGAANMTLETLSRLAAAFKVGLVVEFVPFSEMLRWEDTYSQDSFNVTKIDDDIAFIAPDSVTSIAKANGYSTITETLENCASDRRSSGRLQCAEGFEGIQRAANAPELQPKEAAEMSGLALGAGAEGGGR